MPRKNNTALLIFIKNPVAGKVKTRLAVDVGDEQALQIYLKLCQYTRNICENSSLDTYLFYSDFIDTSDLWSPILCKKMVQEGVNLGERMHNALSTCLKNHQQAILIGTDCPSITKKHFDQTIALLNSKDVVIGPSTDGGYYLIAMKKENRSLFTSIEWSTENVLIQTVTKCTEENLDYALLETLTDIDHIADWKKFGWE